jgi:mannitol/fructose-specific phosphotransferase system IIA component (Ntr-type)
MNEVLQHLSAVVQLVGVTEEQATKACATEREALGMGGEVGVALKGHRATKE